MWIEIKEIFRLRLATGLMALVETRQYSLCTGQIAASIPLSSIIYIFLKIKNMSGDVLRYFLRLCLELWLDLFLVRWW